jgi:hypothetical protein
MQERSYVIPNADQKQMSSPTVTRELFERAFRTCVAAVYKQPARNFVAAGKKVAGKSQVAGPWMEFISQDHIDEIFRLICIHFADQAESIPDERVRIRRDLQSSMKLMEQSKAKLKEFDDWIKQQANPKLDFTSALSDAISQEVPKWQRRLSAIFDENEYVPRAQKDLLAKESPKSSRHGLIVRIERLAKNKIKFPRKKRREYLVALISAVRAVTGFASEDEARSFEVISRGAARQMLHNARKWRKANPVDEWDVPIKKARNKKKTKSKRSSGKKRGSI